VPLHDGPRPELEGVSRAHPRLHGALRSLKIARQDTLEIATCPRSELSSSTDHRPHGIRGPRPYHAAGECPVLVWDGRDLFPGPDVHFGLVGETDDYDQAVRLDALVWPARCCRVTQAMRCS
jgi:hypothetical protein